ncbi:MAG TPA: hypothetical protein DGK91_08675 [Clostridium sp.]|jgi:glutathione synthase/RimK-type ligase-like ATP-grasp enzyme|nr:YheC/YheD family protein [Clostridia bacterium]HCW04581.1 hypothetical protein [Clostridium sp.]
MWISFEVAPANKDLMALPEGVDRNLEQVGKVVFGRSSSNVDIRISRELDFKGGENYDNPMKIIISSKLVDKLKIQREVIYQIKVTGKKIVIGPTIGFLLGPHDYLYSPEHMTKYSDRFGIYKKIGGLVYAFSERTIDWKNSTIYGLYYNWNNKKWEYGSFPIPAAIYRRDFHSRRETIERLMEATKGKMFNSWRFGKFYLYKHIKKRKTLVEYLPDTEVTVDYRQVKTFIDRVGHVILKPIYLSRGRGICIISKIEEGFKVSDYRYRDVKEFLLDNDEKLRDFFLENKDFFDSYLTQRYLEMAKVDGAPYDIRVVMQKNSRERWQCSGVECRVAAKKNLITNISRGGYALTLHEALKRSFDVEEKEREKIKEDVYDICFQLCKSLDRLDHHFGEFGIDIALDVQGKPWIIEANVFPSFKGFKKLDYDTYLGIRYTPMLYAAYLAGF